MNILVSGGAGYIGSHTSLALLEAGHNVIIADNLCNSKRDTVESIMRVSGREVHSYEIDVTDEEAVGLIFNNYQIDAVIHFAGFKAVGESIKKPLDYYYNNLISTMVLAKVCLAKGIKKFIFSSSATVYGNNEAVPFAENIDLLPTTNPYGETKAISERILTDVSKANPGLSITILRYFNPVGAHKSGLLGEASSGIPNNLMPYITQVALGKLMKLKVFGNDYPTADGTGVRDYIHVLDLADGHVAALNNFSEEVLIYNLGTGNGTSVLELVKAFEEANEIHIPYEFTARRPGDVASSYADVSKAKRELGWSAKLDLKDMCRDAWNFERRKEYWNLEHLRRKA